MVQDFGEMNATTPDNGGQILDGSLEGVVVLRHDSIVVSHTILSRGNAIENEWSLAQIGDMNQWPHHRPRSGGFFCCPSKKVLRVVVCDTTLWVHHHGAPDHDRRSPSPP